MRATERRVRTGSLPSNHRLSCAAAGTVFFVNDILEGKSHRERSETRRHVLVNEVKAGAALLIRTSALFDRR